MELDSGQVIGWFRDVGVAGVPYLLAFIALLLTGQIFLKPTVRRLEAELDEVKAELDKTRAVLEHGENRLAKRSLDVADQATVKALDAMLAVLHREREGDWNGDRQAPTPPMPPTPLAPSSLPPPDRTDKEVPP